MDSRWQDGHADLGDWVSSTIDLSPYSGDMVILRFRLATANNLSADGWYIDNIAIRRADSMTTFSCSLAPSWNLISLPLTPADGRLHEIFPDAVSLAFAYRARYVEEDILRAGLGYWVRCDTATMVEMAGRNIPHDTIYLNERWNLIGVANNAVGVSSITTIPPGIIETGFYTYNGSSYALTYTLQPGKAYWVKASQPGMIVISSVSKTVAAMVEKDDPYPQTLNKLSIIDARGHRQELYYGIGSTQHASLEQYELPPPPPVEASDVRFASGRFLECVDRNIPATLPIILQSLQNPLTACWTVRSDERNAWSLHVNGSERMLTADGQTQVTVKTALELEYNGDRETHPKDFALEQNSPNPFNPATTIRYDLPTDATVKLEIFNVLGEKIATLVDGNREAGHNEVEWSASNSASGIYFYRMEAVDVNSPAHRFTQVKKMSLLR
jgi:hypothetical protein